jgi:hypothetical protein
MQNKKIPLVFATVGALLVFSREAVSTDWELSSSTGKPNFLLRA